MTQSDINELFYILLNSGTVKKAFFYFFFLRKTVEGYPTIGTPTSCLWDGRSRSTTRDSGEKRLEKGRKTNKTKPGSKEGPRSEFEFILQRISYLCLIVYVGRVLLYLYLFNVL